MYFVGIDFDWICFLLQWVLLKVHNFTCWIFPELFQYKSFKTTLMSFETYLYEFLCQWHKRLYSIPSYQSLENEIALFYVEIQVTTCKKNIIWILYKKYIFSSTDLKVYTLINNVLNKTTRDYNIVKFNIPLSGGLF